MSGGVKDALTQGAVDAVAKLGQVDGFFANPRVHIPLPDSLRKGAKVMKSLGMGRQVEELELAMNRAAEAAVPDARELLVAAVRKMSVKDAESIVTGGNDAATAYFRKETEGALKSRFLPVVTRATEKVGLAQQYNRFVDTAGRFGLVKGGQKVEDYVTAKALDGLYATIAEEEKAIRANPVQAGTELARKVFGAVLGQ
jgi:hypothetical protein